MPKQISIQERVKNILDFMFLLFAEDNNLTNVVMDTDPNSLIEKYEYYVGCEPPKSNWPINPLLKKHFFSEYGKKYNMKLFK